MPDVLGMPIAQRKCIGNDALALYKRILFIDVSRPIFELQSSHKRNREVHEEEERQMRQQLGVRPASTDSLTNPP